MALTERNRNALYQGLTQVVGDEEAVEAMLSQFPSRDQDEPATKDHVAAVEARLDQRMTIGFAETDRRFTRLEATVDTGFAEIDQRLTRLEARVDIGFSDVRRDMADGFAAVSKEVHTEMRRWFLWSYGTMSVLLVAVVTAAKILE